MGAFIPERRQVISPERNQIVGYDDRGRAMVETVPATYGPSEFDFEYTPVVRGAKAAGSFLRDVFFGDANEQAQAIGQAGSAIRGILGAVPEMVNEQVAALEAGGAVYNPETGQLTEFDPTLVMGGAGAGQAVARRGNQALDMSNAARMQRAREMGFNTDRPLYHYTPSDVREFDVPQGDRQYKFGRGVYASADPTYGDRYVREGSGYAEGANAMPLYARGNLAGGEAYETAWRQANENLGIRQQALDMRSRGETVDQAGRLRIRNMVQDEAQRILKEQGYDGVDYLDEVMVFDPQNVRSTSARFDPAMSDSAQVLYSGGGRTGTGIAVGSAIRNEFEREFGGSIPEVTRDTPLLQRVLDPASVNEMTVEMSAPQISSVPIVRAEDLIDRPYITGMSDTSRSGLERVTSVNGVPVDVLMRGGKYFGAQPENIEKGIAFASAPNAVMGQLNRAAAAQSLGGRPVAFIPYGMMPTSPDFATMTTDLMVPYARQVMSKSDKKALDKRIRSGAGSMTNEFTPIPNWVGIDAADEEYLANLGGLRKAVEKALDEFRGAGSLNLSQARAIVTDPAQFNPVFGDIDMIYELNPEAVKNRTFLESNHPSYPAALAGRPLGALRDTEKANIFEFDVLAGTEDTEFYNFRDRELSKGRPFEIGGKLQSPTMKAFAPGGHGRITRDMVDDLVRRGLVIP